MIAGALRGSGRQYIGAIMNVIAYYVIGLPVGITLALKANLGAIGLWTGMAMGNVVHVSKGKESLCCGYKLTLFYLL